MNYKSKFVFNSLARIFLVIFVWLIFSVPESWAVVGQVNSYVDMGPHVPGGINIYLRPNSEDVYSISRFDNSVKLWNIPKRRLVKSTYFASYGGASLVGLCDDGNELIIAQNISSKLRLYKVHRDTLRELEFGDVEIDARLFSCAIGGVGYYVAANNKLFFIDKSIYVYKEILREKSEILSIAVSVENKIAVLTRGGGVSLLSLSAGGGDVERIGNAVVDFKGAKAAQIKFSPDGSMLVVSSFGMGIKVLDAFTLAYKGAWESISAGVFNTGSLPVVTWRNNREIVSAGDIEPMIRNINNRGELSSGVRKFETPFLGVSDVAVLGDLILGGTDRGSLVVMAGRGDHGWEFESGDQTKLYESIEFSINDDMLYRLTKRGSQNFDYRWDGDTRRTNDGGTEWRRLEKIVNPGGGKTLDCSSVPLVLDGVEYQILGLATSSGLYAKSARESISFEGWNFGVAWSSCVDSTHQYVVIGGEKRIQLYQGVNRLLWTVSPASVVRSLAISPARKYVAVLLGNNTIEFRNFNTGELLWTLISPSSELDNLASADFVLTLPDGYTNAGVKFLGRVKYRVEVNGNRAQVVSADEFFDVFYRPDLVNQVVYNDHPVLNRVKISIFDALKVPPPRVEVGDVIQQVTLARRITVPYKIYDVGGGVSEVRVFQNGKLISSDGIYKDALGKSYVPIVAKNEDAVRYVQVQRNLQVEKSSGAIGIDAAYDDLIVRSGPEKKCNPCSGVVDVDVIPGTINTITVVAFNKDNTIQSAPTSVDFQSTLPKEEPQLWVLGVGINKYQSVVGLNNARKDAEDFVCAYVGRVAVAGFGLVCGDLGKAQTIFKAQNIHVVNVLLDEKATKLNILQALEKVAAQAKPQDTFIWFVAGHGMMDANGLFGMVTHDTKCVNRGCTQVQGHINSNEILEAGKRVRAMNQLVILDTCHSGGLDSKLSGLYDARVSLLAKNMGLHLYASAQATEEAQDGVPGTNGVFTGQLLAGIRGGAPKNMRGQISMLTLGEWARQKTVQITGSNGKMKVQTPVIQHFGQDAPLAAIQ